MDLDLVKADAKPKADEESEDVGPPAPKKKRVGLGLAAEKVKKNIHSSSFFLSSKFDINLSRWDDRSLILII